MISNGPAIAQISRSCHYLMLNISQMVKDTAIVAMECNYETIPKLSNGTICNVLAVTAAVV